MARFRRSRRRRPKTIRMFRLKFRGSRKRVIRRRGGKTGTTFKARAPVPSGDIINFTYYERITLNPGINSAAKKLYFTNSMFSPDAAGAGHQPRGFDQWKQLYKNYEVLSSSLTAHFVSEDNTAVGYIAVSRDGSELNIADITDVMEMPYIRSKRLKPVGSSLLPTGDLPTAITSSWSNKLYQRDVTRSARTSATGVNPAVTPVYEVGAVTLDTLDGTIMDVQIKMNFRCRMYNAHSISAQS